MSINNYSGLQGSGKSYEVVSSVIVPAVCNGRRVVTNISGIDNEAIIAYCIDKFDIEPEKCGSVFYVDNDTVRSPVFFPTIDSDYKSTVKNGDLVAIDEAYKIWGSDCSIPNEHKVFFREHRHYTHPVTGVSCDLVLMTQVIGDLHRVLKVVIEQSFKCHKAKGIGRNNLYTVTMWEGWKQHQKLIIKDWTKTYNPEIFPLYKSYAGSQQGKEMASDTRQNIFSDKRLLYKIVFLVLVVIFCLWRIIHFFYDKIHPEKKSTSTSISQPLSSSSVTPPVPPYSPTWRIVGALKVDGIENVILQSEKGLRLVPRANFTGYGYSLQGTVDGQIVTRFSGTLPQSQSNQSSQGTK